MKSPVYSVKPVPLDKIRANDYNPNHVAPMEMRLLYRSIKEDGYTMPIVCIHDCKDDTYHIVDGYHRYRVMVEHDDIRERENGMLPVAVIDKPIEDLYAATVRHNRARGTHDISLMAAIVSRLDNAGWKPEKIARELGMDGEEVLRLKQVSGLPSIYAGSEFGRAWVPGKEEEENNNE